MKLVDASLEDEYVFSQQYPQRAVVYEAISDASAQARRDWPLLAGLAYGSRPRERMDLFPGSPGAPLLIFIHGGYWSKLHWSSFSYVAPPFLRRGFSVAVLGYPMAPSESVAEIVRSVCNAVKWLANEGAVHLPLTSSFYLCGHSAGAHLATMVATTRWTHDLPDGTRAPPVRGCAALSGIFDLLPLLRTSIAGRIGLQRDAALALSPVRQPVPLGWLLAGVGGMETSAFVAQTRDYVHRCRMLGVSASMLMLPDTNHYTVLLDLGRDDGAFIRAVHERAIMDAGGHAAIPLR